MSAVDSSQFDKKLPGLKALPEIVFLMGEEEILVSGCLKSLRDAFAKLYGASMLDFNQDIFYGEKDEGARILDACGTLPMGMEKRLVILNHGEEISKETEEALLNYVEAPNPSTVLIILWNGKPSQTSLAKGLPFSSAQKGILVKCWKLTYDDKRADWVRGRLIAKGKDISREAAFILAQEGGESLRDLEGEIEKVLLFTGSKKVIEASDVRQTLSFRRDQNAWDFINELEAGRIRPAGTAMERCLEQGEEPILLLNLMARSARKPPAAASKAGAQLELFKALKESDLALKSGHGLESGVFERLLVKF